MILALLLAAQVAAAPAAPITFETARELPVTPGGWTYLVTASGSEARFSGGFTIRCDRASRTVTLARAGAAGPADPMAILTDTLERRYGATTVNLRATDPLLDSIALSRGRFVVAGGGGAVLVVPTWPEAARSIEDCRN